MPNVSPPKLSDLGLARLARSLTLLLLPLPLSGFTGDHKTADIFATFFGGRLGNYAADCTRLPGENNPYQMFATSTNAQAPPNTPQGILIGALTGGPRGLQIPEGEITKVWKSDDNTALSYSVRTPSGTLEFEWVREGDRIRLWQEEKYES